MNSGGELPIFTCCQSIVLKQEPTPGTMESLHDPNELQLRPQRYRACTSTIDFRSSLVGPLESHRSPEASIP